MGRGAIVTDDIYIFSSSNRGKDCKERDKENNNLRTCRGNLRLETTNQRRQKNMNPRRNRKTVISTNTTDFSMFSVQDLQARTSGRERNRTGDSNWEYLLPVNADWIKSEKAFSLFLIISGS
jgi:hypothetical protein